MEATNNPIAAAKAVGKINTLYRMQKVFGENAPITPRSTAGINDLIDEGFATVPARSRATVKGQVTKGNYLFAQGWVNAHYNEVRR